MQQIFSTTSKGIGGQIKRRYSDFVVEEILANEKICEARRFLGEKPFEEKEQLAVPEKHEGKEHLHLDLEKINKDQNYAINKIARFVGCSKKRIGYAGLKDKRAVTCQRISVFSPDTERLKIFSEKGIVLRNAEWSRERIEIGSHKGNRFTTTIRDIGLGETEIKQRLEKIFNEIAEKGIANFFGEQRFGGMREITHIVGRHIVKGEFEKAVMLYLTASFEKEKEEIKQARKNLSETGNFKHAAKEFPKECGFERAMIGNLCGKEKDFAGAIRALPKHMRYLFTHALQSFLFNKIIQERIKQGIGLQKIEGDILNNGKPAAPLFGYESEFAEGKSGEIEKQILKEEGISLQDFRVKEIPELSSRGARKAIVLFPAEMKIMEIGKDAFFPEKRFAKIRFTLEKGCYATTVLREIMKASPE